MNKKAKLIPVDKKQCQAQKPNGCNAFTIGGVPKLIRCLNKPTVIVTEVKPASDGMIGSMSLCDDCLPVLIKQAGAGFFTSKPINKRGAK